MAIYNANVEITEMYAGNVQVIEAYLGNEKIFGNTQTEVTYYVDSEESYVETYNQGDSVLSPQSFTPTKTDYTFLGWREDNTASSDVLSTKTASGATMSLYAVFQKTITVTYYTGASSSATAQTNTGTQYYNNTNILDPTFNIACTAITNWSVRGWTTASSGGASTIDYQDGVDFTVGTDTTIYSCYMRTVTVAYNKNGGSGTMSNSTGIAYHHSLSGSTNAAIVLSSCSYTRTNYGFRRWRLNSTSGTAYNAGATYASTSDATMYVEWYSATKQTFNYNGKIQSYTAPVAGTYKLEVYGAQGGTVTLHGDYDGYSVEGVSAGGGKGGYSYGNVSLTAGQTIYIVVGGQAATKHHYYENSTLTKVTGGTPGYNGGGGTTTSTGSSSGGGATHIGKSNAVLKSTTSANVFIVAGGGGGGAVRTQTWDRPLYQNAGGAGGGTSGSAGGIGSEQGASSYAGQGGTQSAGGSGATAGTYGQGGTTSTSGGGGGGGYYGGGSGRNYNGSTGGGGGSGYIGGVTGTKATSANQRSGNGIAYITPPK